MKQATVKLPSGEYLIVGVTKDSSTFRVFNVLRKFCYWYGVAQICHTDELPPGSWQLLGADPVNLTEQEAGDIVERDWNGAHQWYKDYLNPDTRVKVRPTTSLSSLAQSLGIEKPFVVLKNK